MKSLTWPLLVVGVLVLLVMLAPNTVFAHQPFCEAADLTPANAWKVPNSEVSYAYFGNVYPATDVDYFTFDATVGQDILISLSIPDIEGQEDYDLVIAVFGPGVEGDVELPNWVEAPEGQSGMTVPLGDEAEYWYEPFGRQYYWNWDNYFFVAPETATYTAMLWHPEERIGRYSFVLGEREEFGGDMDCMLSMATFWTPLVAGESPYTVEVPMVMNENAHVHEDGQQHDHSQAIESGSESAPIVDLSVMPLADGSFNVRVQTLNFVFAPQSVDQEPVMGEGHAHLYVDGNKIARLYGEWYHLESLPEGAEVISVNLYANNHQPLAVDGAAISDMVMIADLLDE